MERHDVAVGVARADDDGGAACQVGVEPDAGGVGDGQGTLRRAT
ncbi:MAG: hypothetical protein R3F59_11790 [Myxococcota bacterium]